MEDFLIGIWFWYDPSGTPGLDSPRQTQTDQPPPQRQVGGAWPAAPGDPGDHDEAARPLVFFQISDRHLNMTHVLICIDYMTISVIIYGMSLLMKMIYIINQCGSGGHVDAHEPS